MGLKKGNAFTLSEVLITIVIIGIIAAITVPTIMNNTKKHEYRTALKKAISVTSNAMSRHFAMTGLTATDYTSSEEIVDEIFKSQTNTMDTDVEFTSEICSGAVFATTDGMIFCVNNFTSESQDVQTGKCNYLNTIPCVESDAANLWIDVNGERKPNKITESSIHPNDIYQAQIYSKSVLPYGLPTIEVMYGINNATTATSPTTSPDTTPATQPDTQPPVEPPTQPTEPTTQPPTEPETTMPTSPTDYSGYNPNDWPSFMDFLRWLFGLFGITLP